MKSAGWWLRGTVVFVLRRWRMLVPVIAGIALWIGINNWWNQPRTGGGSYQSPPPSPSAAAPPAAPVVSGAVLRPIAPVSRPPAPPLMITADELPQVSPPSNSVPTASDAIFGRTPMQIPVESLPPRAPEPEPEVSFPTQPSRLRRTN